MRGIQRAGVVLPLVIVLVATCGSPASSPPAPAPPTAGSVARSPAPSSASLPTGSPVPSVAPTASVAPGTLSLGALVETVSDRIRVRSAPRVADDSVKYEPVLALGTDLTVIGGPVVASGFTWMKVGLEPGLLDEGVTTGWVAIADHDGTPWVAKPTTPGDIELAIADVERAPATIRDARGAGTSIEAFAVDAYRQLLRDKKLDLATSNVVFSPTSIAIALGMTRAGARGRTADEMDVVLHVDGWDELGVGLNGLSQALASRSQRWTDYDDATREVALRMANAVFAQRGWAIEAEFLAAIAESLGAGVNLVDYIADPHAARGAINAWVERRTSGRIPELLQPPQVRTTTRLYLVNAIYLKAEWDEWFGQGVTEDRTFVRLDGSKVQVPTMIASGGALGPQRPFAKGDGWRATELLYRTKDWDDPKLAMTIIEPDDLVAFESSLTPKVLDRIVDALDQERGSMFEHECGIEGPGSCYSYDLDLYLPRFAIETRASLKDLLAALGMPTAFAAGHADFSGIHEPTDPMDALHISEVIHQANIDVDEKGTEAAAATAVGAETGGGPSALQQIRFRVDHPFLFLLRDTETGAILFMGRVVDPSVGR